MRFFKYLVFLFLPVFAHANWMANGNSAWIGSTPEDAAIHYYNLANSISKWGKQTASALICLKTNDFSYTCYTAGMQGGVGVLFSKDEIKCPSNGSPATRQYAIGEAIDLVVCAPNPDGTFCKYDSPGGKMNWGDHIRVTYSSVGTAPVSSCTPKKENEACNPKDPYGGCFKPPNDKCTRFADGSIACPPDEPLPVPKSQCDGGATYCERPPTGCPAGYVSGSFNGKQLCVKSSPSTPDPKDPTDPANDGSDSSGSGTSTTQGTSTSTSTNTNADGSSSTTTTTTTTNNTTVNNFKIDLSAVVNAVNAVTAQLISVKSEIVNALGLVDKKLDVTNTKIDTTNAKLTDLNASSLKQEQLLKDIRDKTVSDQPASSASTDLTGVHTRLDAIKEGIDKKNTFDEEYLAWQKDPDFKQDHPDFSGDSKIEILQSNVLPDLNDNYVNASSTCPPPLQISFNLLKTHTIYFSYDVMCFGASYARPFIIFSGMLIAFLIVTGAYRGSSDA